MYCLRAYEHFSATSQATAGCEQRPQSHLFCVEMDAERELSQTIAYERCLPGPGRKNNVPPAGEALNGRTNGQ